MHAKNDFQFTRFSRIQNLKITKPNTEAQKAKNKTHPIKFEQDVKPQRVCK